MNTGLILHFLGLGLTLLLLRLGGGPEDVLTRAAALGWALVLVGLFIGSKLDNSSPGDQAARRWRFGCQILGAMGLAVTTALSLELLGEMGAGQSEVLLQVSAALLILLSSIPLWTVERVRSASPVMLPVSRIRVAGYGGLSVALALALLFPVNYLASAHNIRWDYSYFKTAEPGDVTRDTIANMDEPIQAWLFFPNRSDVTEEIRTYFDQIQHPNLEVEYVDQALEAELAKTLKVQKNGVIALVRGDGEAQQIQRIRIGDDLSKAERKLKKLDKDVSKALIKLASDPRQAYITVGHGEMYWDKKNNALPARTIEGMKAELKRLNFKVSELGAAQGLASEVPEDADLVVVVGPTNTFMKEELEAIDAYRRDGGSLWLALDPGTKTDLSPVLEPLGLAYDGQYLLAGSTNVWVATRRITDRYNIFTNKTSRKHPSVSTLAKKSKTTALLTPLASPITILESPPFKVEVTIRTLAEVWLDQTQNVRFDPDTEEKKDKGWPLSVAVAGTEEESEEFRVLVTGDATWASDLVLPLSMGNQEFLRDGLAWLVDEPSFGGSINDEEDVKIQHTKGDDAWMFYATALLIPVLIFVFGMARVRSRRKEGAK
jgi:hypothetical protein